MRRLFFVSSKKNKKNLANRNLRRPTTSNNEWSVGSMLRFDLASTPLSSLELRLTIPLYLAPNDASFVPAIMAKGACPTRRHLPQPTEPRRRARVHVHSAAHLTAFFRRERIIIFWRLT
jgi:hypothetical protein